MNLTIVAHCLLIAWSSSRVIQTSLTSESERSLICGISCSSSVGENVTRTAFLRRCLGVERLLIFGAHLRVASFSKVQEGVGETDVDGVTVRFPEERAEDIGCMVLAFLIRFDSMIQCEKKRKIEKVRKWTILCREEDLSGSRIGS